MDFDYDYDDAADDADDALPPDRPYILKTFHPRSRLPPIKIYLDEAQPPNAIPLPPEPTPAPFTYADFLFAERMVNTSASAADVDFLLTNMNNGTFVEPGATKISFKNSKQMLKFVDEYAKLFQGFEKTEISVPHMNSEGIVRPITREVWRRDPVQWLSELLRDPDLNGSWEWHAFHQTLHIPGKDPESLVTAPMSATDAWKGEESLPEDPTHVQIPLSYYSDKSNAARFATVPIHPISLRPSNIDKELANRNGHWFSNGLVGLLPDMSTPAGEEGNSNWPVTKRRLYHECLKWILGPLFKASKEGCGVHCGDGQFRVFYPRIMIASLDLEEQFICACGRGSSASHPCPRCRVHRDDQGELLLRPTLRTHQDSANVLQEYRHLMENGDTALAKACLTQNGLYPIENVFWSMDNTDIHAALSFETVHSIWIGLFGSHLFPLLMDALTHISVTVLMRRFEAAPSFPNLKHIYKIDLLSFADGAKYFSVLQQILPYVADLVHNDHRPLLRLLRCLAAIAIHVEMKWQTTSRIETGRSLIEETAQTLQLVIPLFPDKKFAFPKLHQLVHLFDDFIAKGTDEYLNCKVGENMHQGLIQHFAATNKKDFIKQICTRECRVLAMSRIRYRYSRYNAAMGQAAPNDEDEDNDFQEQQEDIDELAGARVPARANLPDPRDTRVALEARLATAIGGMEKPDNRDSKEIERNLGYFPSHQGQPVFQHFHQKLIDFIRFLGQHYEGDLNAPGDDVPMAEIPGNLAIEINAFRLIKHSYYSLDNGAFMPDLIRCTPSFHKRTRFDTVLVSYEDALRPARLHLVFEFSAHGIVWQAALVSYFTPLRSTVRDQDIGMT